MHKLTEEEQFQMVAKKYPDAYGDVASSLESEGALESMLEHTALCIT